MNTGEFYVKIDLILRYRFSVSSGSIAVRSALDFDHFNDFCVLNDPKESTDFFPF